MSYKILITVFNRIKMYTKYVYIIFITGNSGTSNVNLVKNSFNLTINLTLNQILLPIHIKTSVQL